MNSSGKRKRDASRLSSGGYIPQQDGSGDMTIEFSLPMVNASVNYQYFSTYDTSDLNILHSMA